MSERMNRRVVLARRPVGVPGPEHFRLEAQSLDTPAAGQFVVENLYLSVDPAQRGYVNDENNYAPPVPIGDVMRAMAVGRVIESHHPDFQPGEYLYGWFGWQDFWIGGEEGVLRRVDPRQAPLSAGAGLLGINGLTAWLALHDIGKPKAGDTVVVTAAAGAVGSLVGQLAKQTGCRTVAVVGSAEKGRICLERYGYDAYVDYHDDLDEALAQVCPQGVDLFFDNVAGPIADSIIRRMNLFGRVVQCGTMSVAVWLPPPQGPRIEREILTRRLRIEGFVIFDHIARFDTAAAALAELLAQGRLAYDEDVEDGLEHAPQALLDVYSGRNRGKKLIRLRN